ncbi:hypothetical protein AABH71_004768 [Salmonella enterica]|nr:hypothetical protein [Salmonella enterica subsp. enterica serovar Dahomey]EBQ9003880.1 hypothetical protein [Salmonella enterica subsp. enterica serovar Blockley]
MGNNSETKDTNSVTAKSDEGQMTISEGKMRAYMSFQPIVLPLIGELVNEMILRGRSAEEIQAAVESAARSYSAFYQTFIDPQQLTGQHSQEIEHKQDGTRSENVSQTAPKDGPHIDAGSLPLEEFREWIRHKKCNAFRYEETHMWPTKLRDICSELRRFANFLPGLISDLQDPQIDRSADHASELLKEISFYRTLQEAMENFLSATELSKTDPPALWRRYKWIPESLENNATDQS